MPLVWLVERDVDTRNLVTLTYATTDGERAFTRQASLDGLARSGGATAAVEVEDGRLERVDDGAARERYAEEAERMADEHDPDETV